MKTQKRNKIILWAYVFLLVVPMLLVSYLGCVLLLCYFTIPYLTIYAFVLTVLFVLLYKGLRGYTVPLLLLSSIFLTPLITWLLMGLFLVISGEVFRIQEAFRIKPYTKSAYISYVSPDEQTIAFTGKEYGFTFVLPKTWRIDEEFYTPTKAQAIMPDDMAVHMLVQSPDGYIILIDAKPKRGATVAENFPDFATAKKQGAKISERYLDNKKVKAVVMQLPDSSVFDISATKVYILTSERAIQITTSYMRKNMQRAEHSIDQLLSAMKFYDSFIRIGGLHISR